MLRHNKILQYLEPKRQAILDEENIDVLEGKTKEILDCKTVFMNAVLQCSSSNDEEFILTQNDLGWYLNITDQQVYYYLERHTARYKECSEYRSLADKWKEKFCGFDGCEAKENYKETLMFIAKNYSERVCKKIVKMGIECTYIDESIELNKEELKIAQNE